jgi:hypothetical protein
MRLVGTNVARTTEGTITVEFHGQGNELVNVRMSADSVHDDENAVIFAERMMNDLIAARGTSLSAGSGEGASIDETLAAEGPAKLS